MRESLLLLPGMMCDARLFTPQTNALSSSHPIILTPLTGKNTIKELAEDILENAPPRFALLGLSMGGIVAMEVIRQAPKRVSRLALFDTNPLADTPQRAELRDQEIERVQAGQLRAVIRDDMKPNYLADGKNKAEILSLCMDMADTLGAEVFIEQSRALQSRPDQCNTLKNVQAPTLVVCGEDDSLCPIEKHQLMQKLIAGSQLEVIPGAGHLPTLEQPELINKAIANWLAR